MQSEDEGIKKPRRIWRWIFALPVLFVGAVLAGLIPVNVGFLKGFVAELVYDQAQLELALEGPVVVRLGARPTLKTGAIALKSAGEPEFLRVESAFVRLRLGKLLAKKLHATEARLSGGQLDYCAGLHPETAGEGTASGLLEVDRVEIHSASVFCSEHGDWPRLALDALTGSLHPIEPGELSGHGNLQGLPVELSGTIGGIDRIFAKEDFPIDLKVDADSLLVNASGALVGLGQKPAVEFSTRAWSEELGALISRFVDVELPLLGELGAEAEFRAEGGRVGVIGLKGTLGQSRFDALDASVVTGGDRPALTIRGAADIVDVGPFMPDGGKAGNGDVDLRPLIDAFDRLDIDADVRASEVTGLPLAISSVDLDARLAGRELVVDGLEFRLAGTLLEASARFDAADDCPALDVSAIAADFDVRVLDALLSLPPMLAANADGVSLEASSCGYLLSEHLDSLVLTLGVSDGDVSVSDSMVPVAVDTANIMLKPGERSRISGVGRLGGERARVDLAAGSLRDLLGTGYWPLDVDASAAGATFAVRGRAALTDFGPRLSSRVAVSAERTGTLSSLLPVAPDASLPLDFKASVSWDETMFALKKFEVSVGESIGRGNADWNHATEPQIVRLELRSPLVDLERLAALLYAPQGDEPASGDSREGELLFPSLDLDIKLDQVKSRAVDLEQFVLNGRVRDGLIDNASISALVEGDLAVEGTLDVDLRQIPATAAADMSASNVRIGHLLAKAGIVEGLDMHADSLVLKLSTSGSTAEELLVNVDLTTVLEDFEWQIARGITREETEDYYEIQLERVVLESAPGARTIARSRGQVQGVDVGLRLNLPSLDEVFGGEPELPIRMFAYAGQSVMIVDAAFDRSAGSESRTHAVLSGAAFDEIPDFADIESPLPDYQLRSDVVVGGRRLTLPNIEFTVGESSVSGRLSIQADERPRVDFELTSPRLQTVDLQYFVRQVQALRPVAEEVVDIEPEDEKFEGSRTEQAYAIKEGILPRIKDAIDQVQAVADVNIELSIDDLRTGDIALGSAETTLKSTRHEFTLSPLRLRLPDGSGGVDVDYWWRDEDGFLDMNLTAHASGVSYGGLLRMVNPESETEGVLYLDADLSGTARRDPNLSVISQLLDNGNGHIEIGNWPQNIESGLLDLWTANLLIALLPVAGTDSRINCMVARLEGKDGLMKAKTALLDSTTTIVRARGTLDFAEDSVNLLVTPQAKREKLFSASTPVRVTGPVDDISVGIEPAGFLGTMIKWYTFYIYVPFKWLTGERFPEDGTETCYDAMGWDLTPEMQDYFLKRDFTFPPPVRDD